jgi:DNA-binding MarR family transcriptional regulator
MTDNLTKPKQEMAHEVLRSIRQIVRRISEHSRHLSRSEGMTVPQLMCLKALGELAPEQDEITLAQLSQQVQLSPATVSRIVDRLEKGGLVLRERRSRDRRRVCLSLTQEGQARFEALPTPLQEKFLQRLEALPIQEQRTLLDALSQIAGLMDASELDAAPILAPGVEPEPKADPT